MRPRQRLWIAALCAAVAFILAATLHPAAGAPRTASIPLCILCGDRALADFFLNVALFLPLGIVLALGLPGWLVPLAAPALLSGAIELLQLVIPGRHTLLADFLANSLGGAIGVLAVRLAPRWIRPSAVVAGRLALGWSTVAASLVLLTGWLLQPSFPDSTYFGQWTARLGHLSAYEGEVQEARVGDLAVPSRRVVASEELRERLAAAEPVRVTFTAGPPPEGVAPVFSIFDDRQREILLIGVRSETLILRQRTRAAALRLDSPALEARGALASAAPGDTLRLIVWQTDRADGMCARAPRVFVACPLAHTPGRGWALLRDVSTRLWPLHSRPVLDLLWTLLLGLPAGFWLRRTGAGMAGITLFLAAVALAPAASPLVRFSGPALAGAILGVAGGQGVARSTGIDPTQSPPASGPGSRSARVSSARHRSMRP